MSGESTDATQQYCIGDARNLPQYLPESELATAAVVDLAWARPNRNGVGICYDTYSPDNGLWEFVDAVYDALEPGGWAFFDTDSWLLDKLIRYLRESWGDVNATYSGGGFRRVGWVENNATRGHYFQNGGYPVVFAHKAETEQVHGVSASQDADGPPRNVVQSVEWESLKPISPYETWLDAVTESGDLVAIPCAGTAPAAIGLERLYGDDARFVAVDSDADARDAFRQRRDLQFDSQQTQLVRADGSTQSSTATEHEEGGSE
jgi:hypothetical protein